MIKIDTIQEFDEYGLDYTPTQRKVQESLRKKMERVDAWESRNSIGV